jgi:hypothetical protein
MGVFLSSTQSAMFRSDVEKRMHELGVTQVQLAKLMRIGRPVINKCLSPKSKALRIDYAAAIALKLEMPAWTFILTVGFCDTPLNTGRFGAESDSGSKLRPQRDPGHAEREWEWGTSVYMWDPTADRAANYLEFVSRIFKRHDPELTFSQCLFTRFQTPESQHVSLQTIADISIRKTYVDIGRGMLDLSDGSWWPATEGPIIVNIVPLEPFRGIVKTTPTCYKDEWPRLRLKWLQTLKARLGERDGKKYGLHFISESALAKVWTSDNGAKRTTATYPTLAVVGDKYAIRRHKLSSEVSVTKNSARVEEYRDLLEQLKTIAIEEEKKYPAMRAEKEIDSLIEWCKNQPR